MSRRSVEGSFTVLSSPRLFSLSLYLTVLSFPPLLPSFISPFLFLPFPVISFLFPLIILIFAICLSTKASRRNGESSFSALPSFCLLYLSFPSRFLLFPLLFFLSSSACLSHAPSAPLIISRLRNLPIYDGLLEFVSIEKASRSLRPMQRLRDGR